MKKGHCVLALLALSLVAQGAIGAEVPVPADRFRLLEQLKTVKFYPDMNGLPARDYERRPRDKFEFAGSQLLAYDAVGRLYRFKFADETVEWIAISNFIPLGPDDIVCRRLVGQIGSEPVGGSSNRKAAANPGLGEEICP